MNPIGGSGGPTGLGIGNTPSGTFTAPEHISWLDANDFINYPTGLDLTNTSPIYLSGALQKICDAACKQVENYCNRYFVQQTIDERSPDIPISQGHYVIVDLRGYPIYEVNTIYLQVFKYFIPTSLEYMNLFPEEGYYELVPFLSSGVTGGGMFIPMSALNVGEVNFWTNYTFGYPVDEIPDDLYMASVHMATKVIGMQQNPIGASMMEMGRTKFDWRFMQGVDDPLTIQIKSLLSPYKSTLFYSV